MTTAKSDLPPDRALSSAALCAIAPTFIFASVLCILPYYAAAESFAIAYTLFYHTAGEFAIVFCGTGHKICTLRQLAVIIVDRGAAHMYNVIKPYAMQAAFKGFKREDGQ